LIPDCDSFLEKAQKWLDEFEYEPEEDEMPYWPGLYDRAIKVIKELGDPKLLPS